MASTSSNAFPLATDGPYESTDHTAIDNAAGASGNSAGAMEISRGAMIAIIVVVVFVGLIGIGTAVLFYVAKKREWKVRETIRRSARKVVTALTPRRTEFPKSVKEQMSGSGRSRDGRVRLDDVPPTPRLPKDLEKGLENVEVKKADKKRTLTNFSRK